MIYIALLFIILGALIKFGKLYFLIAGYNTMSKEEKANIDIAGIATVFWYTMLGMATIIIIGYVISKFINNPTIEIGSVFVAVVIGIPYLLISSNSEKYKIDNRENDETAE